MKAFLFPIFFAFPTFVYAEEIILPIYTQSQKIADGMFGALGSSQLAPYLGSFYKSYNLKAISYEGEGKAAFGPLFYKISFTKLNDSAEESECSSTANVDNSNFEVITLSEMKCL